LEKAAFPVAEILNPPARSGSLPRNFRSSSGNQSNPAFIFADRGGEIIPGLLEIK
jgi:hypothetical protein